MPRPLLNLHQEQGNKLQATPTKQRQDSNQGTKTGLIANVLRKKRSQAYMDALKKLDAGGVQLSQSEIDDLVATIQGEFPEVNIGGILLGYIAKCYLGGTYEVHVLDYALTIVTHYHTGETLPDDMERARSLAKRGYAYIEVYSDCCRAISKNGNVSVVDI